MVLVIFLCWLLLFIDMDIFVGFDVVVVYCLLFEVYVDMLLLVDVDGYIVLVNLVVIWLFGYML